MNDSRTPLSNKDKCKVLAKQAVISAAMNALPGPLSFMIEMGHKVYELWWSEAPEERNCYIEGARELSEQEIDQLQLELAHETGVDHRAALDLVVESLRGMRANDESEALRSINASLHRTTKTEATITPRRHSRPQNSALSTLIGAPQRFVERSSRSEWPQIEGYELCGILGRGSAGIVYLAKQTEGDQRVCALKVGLLESSTRFERELKAMAAVEHINLVELWGSGQLSNPLRYWIAMPNVGGLTLADLWGNRSLNLLERLRLMDEVLAGLAALHRGGLVHRDLKPANALVTPTLSVKLADFGLSKDAVKEEEATMTATRDGLEGTPAYMSPEQVHESRSAGAEVDVWAFGVMLYETLKGERPFKGRNLMVLGGQILNQALDIEDDWVPKELKPVLKKALDRDKSKRYPSALELEGPYRRAYHSIAERYTHEELRQAWTLVERDQLFLSLDSLDALSAEPWQRRLRDEASDRLEHGLKVVREWREQISAAESERREAEALVERTEHERLQRSAEIADEALSLDLSPLEQWQTWHQGLCELERESLSSRAAVELTTLRIESLSTMADSLHASITAWGRASYAEREQEENQALQKIEALEAQLTQGSSEISERIHSVELGRERQESFDESKEAGRLEGERAAKAWLADLGKQESEEDEQQARETLATRAQLWRSFPHEERDHNEAGRAWRELIDDGSLAQFCFEYSLIPPADPKTLLPKLARVSPKRLGELLTLGMETALPLSLEASRRSRQTKVAERAQPMLSEHLTTALNEWMEKGEGLARLQHVGQEIGFEEGFKTEAQKSFAQASEPWSPDLSLVSQALEAALVQELKDYEFLVAEQRVESVSRRKRWLKIALVLSIILGPWMMSEINELKEKRKQEALKQCIADGQCHSSGVKFIELPAGRFHMGAGREGDQGHEVQVKAFLMSETEVTVAQYRACVEAKRCDAPSKCLSGLRNWSDRPEAKEDHPINCVDWGQARSFAKWVGGELPTEAQWEYAARGGESLKYAGSDQVNDVAWYRVNSNDLSHEVKLKEPNGYQLYDMSGNVWEWTLDEWHENDTGAPKQAERPWGKVQACEYQCDKESADRVPRGGGWNSEAHYLTVFHRGYLPSSNRYAVLGFRVSKALHSRDLY